LFAEVEPCFEILEKAHADCHEANLRIHALARLLFGKWGTFSSTTLSQQLTARLASLMLRDSADDEVAPVRVEWAGYARALAKSDESKLF
jgi:hypothetical protein